jgi:hypothetical protein
MMAMAMTMTMMMMVVSMMTTALLRLRDAVSRLPRDGTADLCGFSHGVP